MVVLVSTRMGRSVVEVVKSIADVMEGRPFPVWRSYGVGFSAFDVFEPIRGLGRDRNG